MPETFDFSEALRRLKLGAPVCRTGWNGKGMFIFLAKPSYLTLVGTDADATRSTERALAVGSAADRNRKNRPCIMMKDAQDMLVPGWLASQTDMLADDWMEVT